MARTSSSDGTFIHYDVTGDGAETVLLVHGLAMGAVRWEEAGYVSRLREHFRVISADMRGHGSSGRPHGSQHYSDDLVVRDMLAVLDAETVGKAHFWGYSLGAKLGTLFLDIAPDRFQSAILGGFAPAPPSPEQGALVRVLREQGIEGFVSALGPNLSHAAREFFLTNDAEALASFAEGAFTWREPEHPPEHPVLVYAGEAAPEFVAAREYSATLPRGVFMALPDANHGVAFAQSEAILNRLCAS